MGWGKGRGKGEGGQREGRGEIQTESWDHNKELVASDKAIMTRSYDIINCCVLFVLHSPLIFKFESVANIFNLGDIPFKKEICILYFFEKARGLVTVGPFAPRCLLCPSVGLSWPTSPTYVTDVVLKALGYEIAGVGRENRWSLSGGPFPGILLYSQGLLLGRWRMHGVHAATLLCPLLPSLI